MSGIKDDHIQSSPWDAQKLDVTGSWSVSKSARTQRNAKVPDARVPETLVAPDIDEKPAGDLLAERFESIDENADVLDWDPDGDTDAVPPSESADDTHEAAARADELDVELLSAADPSSDSPTGEMTIPSFFSPEDTLESEVPRVVPGRAGSGFVAEATASSVWARSPLRAKPLSEAPRIELRRRSRRLTRIDDGSAAETTEWMAQAQATTDADGVPFGPRVGDATDGRIDLETLSDDAIAEVDPEPVRVSPADVVYVRRASSSAAEADPFRSYVLKRRLPEDEASAPPPAWAAMFGQSAIWIVVLASGLGIGCLAVMAITGRLPF